MWYSRTSQRGKVYTFQLPFKCKGTGCKLSFLHNRGSSHTIVGETKMRISHVLCALPGQTLGTLTEAGSHPMALMQCEQYLRRHPNLKLTEMFDTAGTAREIAAGRQSPTMAAVCGEYAANLYGLEILERGIETNKNYYGSRTRMANF